MTDTVSQFIILALILIAAYISIGQSQCKNMWHFITVYWIVLTLKNIADFMKW